MTRDLDDVILDVTLKSGRVTSRTMVNVMREVSRRHARAAEKAEHAAAQAKIAEERAVEQAKKEIKHGEQELAELNRQAQTLADVPIEDASLAEIRKRLQAYDVDFALKQDPDDNKLHIWFKAKDQNRIEKAFASVLAERAAKKEEPALEEVIENVKQMAAEKASEQKTHHIRDQKEPELSR